MMPNAPEPRLDHLYQEVILDHNRNPRNFHEIKNPTHYSHGFNPLCGDDYQLYLKVDSQKKIQEVGFVGNGCAISKSSASIMSTLLKDKTADEAKQLAENFVELLTKDNISEIARKNVGRLSMFEGVKEFPVRVKCATLIWHALQDALKS